MGIAPAMFHVKHSQGESEASGTECWDSRVVGKEGVGRRAGSDAPGRGRRGWGGSVRMGKSRGGGAAGFPILGG